MVPFPIAVSLYLTVILLKGVEGAVTVSGSGGTGIPNQQALTLRCSYTVTPGDVVTSFAWRRVEGNSAVNIVSGLVTPQAVIFLDSWGNKGRFVGDYNSSLDIQLPASHVTSSYAGTYSCEVSGLSDTGQVDVTAAVLSVEGAVTVSGSGGTGIPNQQALTLRCSYTVTPGDVVTAFTWRRVEGNSAVNIVSGSVTPRTAIFLDSWENKGRFVGDYTSSLDIKLPASHVTSSYAWTYSCEVSGLSDTGRVDVTAAVLNPPSISGLPPVHTVTEFTNLRIDCSTYTTPGDPPTTSYTWTYGGSTVSTGAVLDRSNISRSQGGNYTCTASNIQGSDSASVNVDVQYGPGSSVTITPSGPLERVEGSGPFTATCTAVCNPSCTITWRKDSSDLTSGQISLSNVSRTDQGDYTCQAQNSIGGPQQTSITLVVYYLASPHLSFNKSEVIENAIVTVDCDVDSNPTVEMTVRNVDNNTVLVQRNTNTLSHTIQRAQCLHNGSYVCSADNRKTGTVHHSTMPLNVLCSPRHDFRKPLKRVVVQNKYTTATLTADIIANPLPNFTWYRYNGGSVSPISNTTGITVTSTALQSVLQIHITSDADYGDYAVSVQNSVGQNMMVFTLTSKNTATHPDTADSKITTAPVIAGVAIGSICFTLLISGIIILFFYRKGFRFVNTQKGNTVQESSRNQATEDTDNRDYSSLDQMNSPVQYSSLRKEELDKQHYSKLNRNDNTSADVQADARTYEGLTETPPVTYEAISTSTYQNSDAQSQGDDPPRQI